MERAPVSELVESFIEPGSVRLRGRGKVRPYDAAFFFDVRKNFPKGHCSERVAPQSLLCVDRNVQRPHAGGKFLFVGNDKFWVRGVTYGAFRPGPDGQEYHDASVLERDFSLMAANGLNAVRIPHTMPPLELFDIAQKYGLRVMVGLSAEQYAGFLIDRKGAPDVEELVRAKARSCAGHPALLCYALGNEIAAPVVRWLGRARVESYLERLYWAVKAEDPNGLVTYVNYPTTEYLHLPFLDLVTFNVYLESQDRLEPYLARLHNIAGDRPLLMSEIGLDSLRNGETTQAQALEWQLRSTFAPGCAGAFIFSWTDEWHRAGADVEDWAFGITTRDRRPKSALKAVREAFTKVPFPKELCWPRISVIVCTFNGSRTLPECLESLLKLDYPDYEVIVVNDGSTDTTAKIANSYGFRVITTENRGLSSARNTGLKAATGEIIAYIDDDVCADQHWLRYLASTFMNTRHVGVGGPNIAPPGDGLVAECVAHSPGNPVHILLSDSEAEHIPGCNMAFRKAALEAIDGFDPQFRIAGDDVDACWRLQQKGWTLGYSPGAMVWHHRRNSIRSYWKQQHNYGKAESFLERKWPDKYNLAGHVTWAGRVYGNGHQYKAWNRGRIYHGVWGSAPFQSIYQSPTGALESWLSMPEWYLAAAALAPISALGFLWFPLFYFLLCLALVLYAPIFQVALSSARVSFPGAQRSRFEWVKLRTLTALLHLLQPVARLTGRLRSGLTFWRYKTLGFVMPWPRKLAAWTQQWRDPNERLKCFEADLRRAGAYVRRGGDYDRWDLEVRAGMLGFTRLLMAVEDHGAGNQFVRVRLWPRYSLWELLSIASFTLLSAGAALDGAWAASAILAVSSLLLIIHAVRGCGSAIAAVLRTFQHSDAIHDK
jgi:cellulose synthase/poly-beta-1,6-N-acetylglucosamine synthase-like glycosyltransferase